MLLGGVDENGAFWSSVRRVMLSKVPGYSHRELDRIWGIWGSYYNIPAAIFCLVKRDYMCHGQPC